ncbi:maltokinase N-terminal cap-like domain-containing protein [Microbacterium lushaniae]|uniref:Maltokinase n=1 Tax=Microbacterium lushaniae TaxID=2614639 RepID=A0A5J6L574_9MICO|nr:aminoglycoside phosphotransferase [Microbacterium lushaniae]QEW03531.1 aminoglycoside phosphotransferase [Microbacterium lushaniae]
MDSTLACLREWMPRQRWYANKGAAPELRLVAEWDLGGPSDARVQVLLVYDTSGDGPVLYQVPVVWRSEPSAAEIGRPHGMVLVDGTADAAFHDVLYGLVTRGGRFGGADGPLYGEPSSAHVRGSHHPLPAIVLDGEQSNTSLIFRGAGRAHPVICKIFRQVHAGLNPDIELQTALSEAGVRSVPPVVGAVSAMWRAPGDEGHLVAGSLAFAQQFFPGVQDAWRVALRAVERGTDFAGPAERLGVAVAETHAALARLFPTRPATADDLDATATGWRLRLRAALEAAPALEASVPAIERTFARALAAPWPRLQRVHGDLHLGQVIDVPGRGWVLLDFEGEPLRPMSERHAPDFAVRDVAGMLRSFAYAADSVPAGTAGDAHAWAARARAAFLRGYAGSGAAETPDPHVLRAFEVDKALYETVYEARNRPGWVRIPVAAVQRIAAG